MDHSIDTPYGPYLPRLLGLAEMQQADGVLRDAVEAVAELNHDMWAAKRIAEGWRYGEKRDEDHKLHPCLVAYAYLPEAEKAYDRDMARGVVAELLRRGLISV